MTWFQDQRMAFIGEQLHGLGWIQRRDLTLKFNISTPQASTDLKSYLALHPGSMSYNMTKKRYVRTEVKADVFARPECLFKYCPHADDCKSSCQNLLGVSR